MSVELPQSWKNVSCSIGSNKNLRMVSFEVSHMFQTENRVFPNLMLKQWVVIIGTVPSEPHPGPPLLHLPGSTPCRLHRHSRRKWVCLAPATWTVATRPQALTMSKTSQLSILGRGFEESPKPSNKLHDRRLDVASCGCISVYICVYVCEHIYIYICIYIYIYLCI